VIRIQAAAEEEARAWVEDAETRGSEAAAEGSRTARRGGARRGGGGALPSSAPSPSPSPTPAPLPVLAAALRVPPGAVLPGVVSIILTRDTDGALIPYDSVHGITLITGLRLGLLAPLRSRAYHQFVSLPLYQDMAPWNIVFLGGRLDYIDYDTRDKTYDKLIPKAYEVMEVLFNYKRTVEDFKKCGGKAGNPYNFPFVSDCVGSSFSSSNCKDSAAPVPCGDGTCRSDYVTCLRALSDADRRGALRSSVLWAFRAYAGEEGGVDEGESEGGGGSAARLLPPPDASDAYMHALFGGGDRTAGTAAARAREEPREKKAPTRGGAKLGASSDVSQWRGGALEYSDSGVATAPRARARKV
jgi:hypothetical protein